MRTLKFLLDLFPGWPDRLVGWVPQAQEVLPSAFQGYKVLKSSSLSIPGGQHILSPTDRCS